MQFRRTFFTTLLIFFPILAQTNPAKSPPAGASSLDVVKFVVNYENNATDATKLLRNESDKPTKLETDTFTSDFLKSWYAIKAKEVANPDVTFTPNSTPGMDNVTNGETDYIFDSNYESNKSGSIKFKDLSDKINGAMISMSYHTNGNYSTLFFLKKEDGHFKIDDILLEPFEKNNFDPKALHSPGVSEGVRKDIVKALNNFRSLKK